MSSIGWVRHRLSFSPISLALWTRDVLLWCKIQPFPANSDRPGKCVLQPLQGTNRELSRFRSILTMSLILNEMINIPFSRNLDLISFVGCSPPFSIHCWPCLRTSEFSDMQISLKIISKTLLKSFFKKIHTKLKPKSAVDFSVGKWNKRRRFKTDVIERRSVARCRNITKFLEHNCQTTYINSFSINYCSFIC